MNVLCTFFCIPHLINAQISFYPITTFAHSTLFFGVKIRHDLQNLKSEFWKASNYWGLFEALISEIRCFKRGL